MMDVAQEQQLKEHSLGTPGAVRLDSASAATAAVLACSTVQLVQYTCLLRTQLGERRQRGRAGKAWSLPPPGHSCMRVHAKASHGRRTPRNHAS